MKDIERKSLTKEGKKTIISLECIRLERLARAKDELAFLKKLLNAYHICYEDNEGVHEESTDLVDERIADLTEGVKILEGVQ